MTTDSFRDSVTPAQTQLERPAAVKAIGWILVPLTSFQILSATFGIVVFGILAYARENSFPDTEDMSEMPKTLGSFFTYLEPLSFVQLFASIVALISSIQFLKLRRWTRPVLEMYSWLWLIGVVVWAVCFGFIYNELMSEVAMADSSGVADDSMVTMWTVMAVFGSLIWAAPAVVFIYFLRGETVRSAVVR